MRKPRPQSKLWVSSSTFRRFQYSGLIQGSAGILPDEIFDNANKRRAAAAGLRLVICALQVPIFAFFALSLIPADANPSAAVTLSKELREILLVISAVLGLCIGFAGYYHDALTDLLSANLDARTERNACAAEIARLSFGIYALPLPATVEGHFELGTSYHFFIKAFNALAATTVVMLMLTALLVRFKVLEDIYFAPTFSTTASLWVIAFVLITDILGTMLFILTVGPVKATLCKEDVAFQSSACEKEH